MSLTTQSIWSKPSQKRNGKTSMKLYQEGHLTDEQLRAFWAGAIDIAQATRFGQTYTVYIYKQGQVQLVFKEDNLYLHHPNPEVLYFN